MQDDNKCGSCSEKNEGGCGNEHDSGPVILPGNDLSRIRNVIAVMSGKGGVGKSSVTCLLACGFNKKGYKVGVLDADITGPSIPKMLGISGMAENTGFGFSRKNELHDEGGLSKCQRANK